MRQAGRITQWKDAEGYGFITPEGGGPRVFLHISAFARRSPRPVGDEAVTFDVNADAQGRPRARKVAYLARQTKRSRTSRRHLPRVAIAVVFLGGVTAAGLAGWLPLVVPLVYAIVSVMTFLAYRRDKLAAVRHRWRIPESNLLLYGLAGGWPGAMAAQQVYAHKSRKRPFQLWFWFTVAVNVAALGWAGSPAGMEWLNGLLSTLPDWMR